MLDRLILSLLSALFLACQAAYCNQVVKPYTFSAGQIIRSGEINANFDVLYNDYNGYITDYNIKTDANIAVSKLQPAFFGDYLLQTKFGQAQWVSSIDASLIGTGVLPVERGGTGNGALTVHATGIYAGDSTKIVQVVGSAGQSFRVNAASTGIEPYYPATGTVTSVGITGPSIITWSGTPITTSGTFTGTLTNQVAHTFLAGPVNAPPGAPTFRAIVEGDLPGPVVRTNNSNAYSTSTNQDFGAASLVLPKKTDPPGPLAGEIWVNSVLLQFRTDEGAPSTRTVVDTTRTISAGTGLTGGGDLSADRTIALSTPVSVANGGTGVTSLSNVLGTANEISVTGGTARVIGGNVTIRLPDPIVMPGIAAFTPPSGTTAQRPGSPSAGQTRYNTTDGKLEYYNGTAWVQLDNGGYRTIQEEGTNLTQRSTVDFVGTAITASDTGSKTQVTTHAQVNSLADLAANGLVTRTAANTLTARSVAGTADQISVTNGDGVSSNPTIAIASNPTLPGTSHMLPPSGTTAQRPGSPSAGQTRYNSTDNKLEYYNGTAWVQLGNGGTTIHHTNGGRLTTASNTPVTTSDQTAVTTIYFTPYTSNQIATYTGSSWRIQTFSERSLTVPATTNTVYDVFINDADLSLSAVAWTNDTTRATDIVCQDGVWVQSGAATKRYLGSFRTTGVSGQTEDSAKLRLLWNVNNRVARKVLATKVDDSWTYTTDAWRAAGTASGTGSFGTEKVGVLRGLNEDLVDLTVTALAKNNGGGNTYAVSIGVDSATTSSADIRGFGNITTSPDINIPITARYIGLPSTGFHEFVWLERSEAGGTTTWYGDGGLFGQSGLIGVSMQ